MKKFFEKKLRNKGETIVEVMVAFIVLLIVLALFGTAITATGNAEKYAQDKRTEISNAMRLLQVELHGSGSEEVSEGGKKIVSGFSKPLEAKQYVTKDGFVYWVFSNGE